MRSYISVYVYETYLHHSSASLAGGSVSAKKPPSVMDRTTQVVVPHWNWIKYSFFIVTF